MKIQIWLNHENTICYIGKAHLEETNIKRNSSFTSTSIQHPHGRNEERM